MMSNNNILLLLLSCSLVFVEAVVVNDDAEFRAWATKYERVYNTQGELDSRYAIFCQNRDYIAGLNAKYQGHPLFALNNFADQSYAEVAGRLLRTERRFVDRTARVARSTNASYPASFDWRSTGKVTSVKDQESCGSCYAFAPLAAIESASLIFHDTLLDLSEQDVVDCGRNAGCDGGTLESTYEYAIEHGVASEAQYPYTGGLGVCQSSVPPTLTIVDYASVRVSCNNIKTAIAIQPVSVVMYVQQDFLSYAEGIYYGDDCPTDIINHAVLIVGYTPDYWIIKNSWGTGWGENGYARIATGNTCAICSCATYPLDEMNIDPDPSMPENLATTLSPLYCGFFFLLLLLLF